MTVCLLPPKTCFECAVGEQVLGRESIVVSDFLVIIFFVAMYLIMTKSWKCDWVPSFWLISGPISNRLGGNLLNLICNDTHADLSPHEGFRYNLSSQISRKIFCWRWSGVRLRKRYEKQGRGQHTHAMQFFSLCTLLIFDQDEVVAIHRRPHRHKVNSIPWICSSGRFCSLYYFYFVTI